MEYVNASKASRILGISKPDVIKMINEGEIRSVERKGPIYQIPQTEIDRLLSEIERKDAEFIGEKAKKNVEAADSEKPKERRGRRPNSEKNREQKQEDQDQDMLTITDVARKLGIKKSSILYQIKKGKVEAIKGNSLRSPYRMAKNEIPKLEKLIKKSADRADATEGVMIESRIQPTDRLYQEVISIQRNIAETVNRLAAAQEQLVSNFSHLKK